MSNLSIFEQNLMGQYGAVAQGVFSKALSRVDTTGWWLA